MDPPSRAGQAGPRRELTVENSRKGTDSTSATTHLFSMALDDIDPLRKCAANISSRSSYFSPELWSSPPCSSYRARQFQQILAYPHEQYSWHVKEALALNGRWNFNSPPPPQPSLYIPPPLSRVCQHSDFAPAGSFPSHRHMAAATGSVNDCLLGPLFLSSSYLPIMITGTQGTSTGARS